MTNRSYGLKIAACLLLCHVNPALSQSQDPNTEGDSRPNHTEIERSLNDLLKSMPEMKDGVPDDSSPESSPAGSSENIADNTSSQREVPKDVVVDLEFKIAALGKKVKLNHSEQLQLSRLRAQLKIAKTIRQQFKKPRPKKGDRAIGDTYVIANLEVAPGANVLDVRFLAMEGELESVKAMLDYVCQTPQSGFRDFRIISRHGTASDAEVALEDVRRDYDHAKKQQEQYLAYVAQQQAALARIAAARRC